MYLFQTNEDRKLWKKGQDHLIIVGPLPYTGLIINNKNTK